MRTQNDNKPLIRRYSSKDNNSWVMAHQNLKKTRLIHWKFHVISFRSETHQPCVVYLWCSLSLARHTEDCAAGSWQCCFPSPRGQWLSWQQVEEPCCGARLASESGRNLDWQYPPTETSASVYRGASKAERQKILWLWSYKHSNVNYTIYPCYLERTVW